MPTPPVSPPGSPSRTPQGRRASSPRPSHVTINSSPATSVREAQLVDPCGDEAEEKLDSCHCGRTDNINTEFLYYSAMIREVAASLTSDVDRQLIIPWIRKLFRPEYHTSRFRSKRNQFLLHLTLTIMNDEACGIFAVAPPCGALPLYASIEPQEPFPKAEWELDTMWRDVLQGLPDDARVMTCSVHRTEELCEEDHDLNECLDEEFKYYLYLARPYAVVLRSTDDRTKVATWLQTLCTIQPSACTDMKKLRNEYIVALLGYISDLRVAGPFMEFPAYSPLPPLIDLAKIIARNPPIIDPCTSEASEFLAAQPVPDEGAFCYIAITGDVLDSSLNELD